MARGEMPHPPARTANRSRPERGDEAPTAADPARTTAASNAARAASIKPSAVRGIAWTSFIHGYRIGVTLLTTWILALLLETEEFGLASGAAIVVGFLLLLKDLGTGSAIVQRAGLDERLLSSVFWTNVLLGTLGTVALWTGAPLIAGLLGDPGLIPLLQVLSLMTLLAGLGTTHQSLLQRELRFARIAKIEIVSITAGAVTGITSALCGAGVWALVLQSMTVMALGTLLSIALHRWRPRCILDFREVQRIAGFSLNLTGFHLLNYLARNVDHLLVLRVIGSSEAGVYFLATRMLLFPLSSIHSVLSRVLFPLFARIQDDDDRLRNAFLKISATIALLVLPMIVGFGVLADPIVRGVLPAKWLPVVPLIGALALVAALQCLTTSVGNLFLAKARADLLFRWGLLAAALSISAYAIGVQFGVLGVATSHALVSMVLFAPAIALPLRLIRTSLRSFFAAIWRPASVSALMGATVWTTGLLLPDLTHAPLLDLAVRMPLGVAVYAWASWRLDRDHVREVLALLRSRGEAAAG